MRMLVVSESYQQNQEKALCRGGYFLLHNREQPSPGSLSNIKKSAVLRRENISKKNGEMSCNFWEIIKKTIFPCLVESPPEGYPRHPPPLRKPLPHIFHVLDSKCESQVRDLLASITRGGGGGGRGDLRNGASR